MKNGCPECEKLDDDTLCPMCEIGMLEHDVEVALDCYVKAVNKLLDLEKNKNGKET